MQQRSIEITGRPAWACGVAIVTALLLAGCSASLSPDKPADRGAPLAPPPAETPVAAAPSRVPIADAPSLPRGAAAPQSADAQPPAQKGVSVAALAQAHAASPGDPQVARAYARVLKSAGKRSEALTVLDAVAAARPDAYGMEAEHGLLALELGHAVRAETLLLKAAAAPEKDWRVLSGLGVALASQGKQKPAQHQFAKALELSPGNPTVLNNMAMSLVLDRKVDEAERVLQRAAKSSEQRQRVARNLALTRVLKVERDIEAAASDSGGLSEAVEVSTRASASASHPPRSGLGGPRAP